MSTRLAACCAALAASGRRVAEAYLLSLAPGGAEVTPVATPADTGG